jgi:acyl-CoA reductase-like NAD-dependent aldehyde dehydrogenase
MLTSSSRRVWGAFCNSGQSCSSVERLYVHESVANDLTRRIVGLTKQLKQGTGDDESTSIGAMSSERQISVVEDHVEDFRAAGAKIETGGRRNPALEGLFYEPTVITNANNEMRAMQEETFGPTLPIMTFTDEEEAVRLANDSEFGLTASVWTRDLARGKRIAAKISAGSVCINEVLYTHGIAQTPWGGFKNSGRGRTHGIEGLMELVQPQHIHVNRLSLLPAAWWMPYSSTAVEAFRGFARFFATGSIIQTARLLPQLGKRIIELRKRIRS